MDRNDFSKKYEHTPAIGRVMCIRSGKTKMLMPGSFYDLLKKNGSLWLIRFNSGGACWYDSAKFTQP